MRGERYKNSRIRAFYPNYFAVRELLAEASGERPSREKRAFPVPELDLLDPAGRVIRTLPLKTIDVFILSQSDRVSARRYIDLLVAESKKDLSAPAEKEAVAKQFLKTLRLKFGAVSFIENESVVPSLTANLYDEILLSHKGKMLLDLYREGYPVPDFCIMTSQSYQLTEHDREACLCDAISNLEDMTGARLDDTSNALVFAMRSATPQYIPGVMPTYLSVGVTKLSLRSLELQFGQQTANKIYLNNLQSICRILAPGQEFARERKEDCSFTDENIENRIEHLLKIIRPIDERILYDARHQANMFMKAAHGFFTRNQDLIYTFQRGQKAFPALILQKMVWTIRNQNSYPGVLYSRHPRTGLGMQIESFPEIFGEDIMTGTIYADQREYFDRKEIREEFPAIYHVTPILPKLEVKLLSPATIEFAVESFDGISFFAILQLNMSELTGRSTLLTAIDLLKKKIITPKRVIQLIRPYHLRQIFSERIDDHSLKQMTPFGSGASVLPRSAVSARIFFTMAKALEAKKKGEKVCLCKENFIPSETIFMGELDVILCMNPLAIHVVTACLGYGIPAFINLKNHHMELAEDALSNGSGQVIREGDWITVSSKHHFIYIGKANYKPARFEKYLEGKSFEMDPKEEKVFVNMARAYREYQKILSTLETEEAMTLPDLVKLIRNDYERQPEKAVQFVNGWFDSHKDYYYTEILKSGLGSHQDQHKIYSLLTTDRRILFFKKIIRKCQDEKLNGFTAGAFMLGRFLCKSHPRSFWQAFLPRDIVFLLNESILFEKYMQVLYEFGERHLNRTKNKILTEDLRSITLSSMDTDLFLTLKLTSPDWKKIEKFCLPEHDQDTLHLIRLLKKPYGELYDYNLPWSFEKLQSICSAEKTIVPDPDDV